jgi:glutathionylspermidine synthase
MNDKEYNTQKKRIKHLIDKWVPCLGLRWWAFTVAYERGELASHRANFNCLAFTSTAWEYLDGKITFSLSAVANQTDDELEMVFVHECCHILVNEMRNWESRDLTPEQQRDYLNHEERVVTMLAKAFIWTREAGEGVLGARRKKSRLATKKSMKK